MKFDFTEIINKKKRQRLTAFLLFAAMLVCFFALYASATEDTTPDVPIISKTVTGTEMASLPNKKIYRIGEELDTTGATIKLTFSDGSTEIKDVNTNWCSGFNSTKAGETEVSVVYPFGGQPVSFKVTVKDLAGIKITKTPKKTEYFVGEYENADGLEVTQVFTDGSTEKLSKGYTSSGFETMTAGIKTVVVSYGGFTASYTITVKGRTVTKISVKSAPARTRFFIGDSFDSTGMVIIATYNDKSTGDITEYVTITGFDTTEIGEKTVTVYFISGSDRFSTSFKITVAEPQVTGIGIAFPPERTSYLAGEDFDPTGMAVALIYENGKRENVTEGFTFSGFSSDKVGEKTVTVTLNGFNATFNVIVTVDETHVHSGEEKIIVSEPTCSADGSEGTVCSVCGETFNIVTIEALPHTFGEWVHVSEPTPDADGKYTRQCSVCQHVDELTVPKLTPIRVDNEVVANLTGENYFPADLNFSFKDVWALLTGNELADYNAVVRELFGAEVFGVFDLEFTDISGLPLSPVAPVTYTVPLSRITNSDTYENVKLLKDGNSVEFTLENGNLVFTCDAPGRLVIAGTPIVITTEPPVTTQIPSGTEGDESGLVPDDSTPADTTSGTVDPGRSHGIPSGVGTVIIIVIAVIFVIVMLFAVYYYMIKRYY